MDYCMAIQVKMRLTTMIEHLNLRCIADTKQGILQSYGIVNAKLTDIIFSNGCCKVVMSHIRYPRIRR